MFDPTLSEKEAHIQRLFWFVGIFTATLACLILSISFERIELVVPFVILIVSSSLSITKSWKVRTSLGRKFAVFDAGTTGAMMMFTGTIALFQAKGYISKEMGENLFMAFMCLIRLIIAIFYTKTF